MPSRFTRVSYGQTPSLSGRTLKKNYRVIQERIIAKKRQEFKDIMVKNIKKLMLERLEAQQRTDNGSDLPDHTLNTSEWRYKKYNIVKYGAKYDKKLKWTGKLIKNLTVRHTPKTIRVENNALSYKNGKNGSPVPYADFLEDKGWINLDIPKEWRLGGSERVILLREYGRELNKEFEKHLYDRRFK